jgi:Skp family chaperone for outer membrane proteins
MDVFRLIPGLVLLGCVIAPAAELAAEEQSLALVNVSFVFEKYDKVPDIQRRMDEVYKARKAELQQRAQDLVRRSKDLEQNFNPQAADEKMFDLVQRMRRDQFIYERDLRKLNQEIQADYTREMRAVLSDIRVMIRSIAEKGGYALVLRSPDTDDPEVTGDTGNPADRDKKTYLELIEPKTVAQLIERFNRNPVLYGARTTDITQDVLKRLNEEYLKRSIGLPAENTKK